MVLKFGEKKKFIISTDYKKNKLFHLYERIYKKHFKKKI